MVKKQLLPWTSLLFIVPFLCEGGCSCVPPVQGPAGPPGTIDTFGSAYSLEQDLDIGDGEQIPIENVNSNVNVNYITPFQIQVTQGGHYFVILAAASNSGLTVGRLSLFNTGNIIPGTGISLANNSHQLISASTIVSLTAGDILDLRSTTTEGLWLLGSSFYDEDVTAFLTLFRLGD